MYPYLMNPWFNAYTVSMPVMDDEDIRENVLSNISIDPYLPQKDKDSIDAAVDNGFVTLTGNVSTRSSKFIAFGDAFWSSGVVDVMNDIKVEQKSGKSKNSE